MKGKRILTLGLFSLFSLTSCGKADAKSVVKPQEASIKEEQGEVIQNEKISPQVGAAFKKFKEIAPSYTGDEDAFLDSLSQGNFNAFGVGNQSVDMSVVELLEDEEINHVYNTIYGPQNISRIKTDFYTTLTEYTETYCSTYKTISDYYSGDYSVTRNLTDNFKSLESQHKIKMGHTEYTEINFMTNGGYQVASYYTDILVEGEGDAPSSPWGFQNTNSLNPVGLLEYQIYDIYDMMGGLGYFVYNSTGHLYYIGYYREVDIYDGDYYGYSYQYYEVNTQFSILDLNTIQNPKFNNVTSLMVVTNDHDDYGRQLDDFEVVLKSEGVVEFEYDGDSLNTLYQDKDITDFLELVPEFYGQQIICGYTKKGYSVDANSVPTTFNGSTTGSTDYSGAYYPMTTTYNDDGSITYSCNSSIYWSSDCVLDFTALSVSGIRYTVNASNRWTATNQNRAVPTPLTVEYVEDNVPVSEKIFETATISEAQYTICKTPNISVQLHYEITLSYDEHGAYSLSGKIQVINPANNLVE